MRFTSEKKGLTHLKAIKNSFAETIRNDYEHRAKSCATCETPGACCLDAHFVNVRISRLEAVAISQRLEQLSPKDREVVYSRIEKAINKYKLDSDEHATFACPLFESRVGCLIHEYGKPLPCIAHACYERKEDLQPDELLTEREIAVDRLNVRVYGRPTSLLPLPLAVRKILATDSHG